MQVIKAADKALKEKDDAIKAGNDALKGTKDQLDKTTGDLNAKNKELTSVSRNPFVLITSGTSAGALLAMGVPVVGISILAITGIAILFKL